MIDVDALKKAVDDKFGVDEGQGTRYDVDRLKGEVDGAFAGMDEVRLVPEVKDINLDKKGNGDDNGFLGEAVQLVKDSWGSAVKGVEDIYFNNPNYNERSQKEMADFFGVDKRVMEDKSVWENAGRMKKQIDYVAGGYGTSGDEIQRGVISLPTAAAVGEVYKRMPWLKQLKDVSVGEARDIIENAKDFGVANGTGETVVTAFKMAQLEKEKREILLKKLESGTLTEAEQTRVGEIDKELESMPKLPGLAYDMWTGALGSTVQSFYSMVDDAAQVVRNLWTMGKVAANASAETGLNEIKEETGLDIKMGQPFEVNEADKYAAGVMALGMGVGLVTGGVGGMVAKTLQSGMFSGMWKKEAVDSYGKYTSFTNKNGEQLIDDDTARMLAIIDGAVQGGIEYFNFGSIVNLLGMGAKGATKAALQEVMKRYEKNGAASGKAYLWLVLKDKLKGFGKAVLEEDLEEGAQAAAANTLEKVVRNFYPDGDIEDRGWAEILGGGLSAMAEALPSVALMVGGGAVVGTGVDVARARRMNKMMADATLRPLILNQNGIGLVNGLGGIREKSTLAKKNPAAFDKAVDAMAREQGVENVFVAVDLAKGEAGNAEAVEVLQQAAVAGGMSREEVMDAVETTGTVALPVNAYIKIAPEVREKLNRFMSLTEDGECLAAIQRHGAELTARMEQAARAEATKVHEAAVRTADSIVDCIANGADAGLLAEAKSEVVGVVERYGEKFKEGFEVEYEKAVRERDGFVDGYVKDLEKGMGQGVAIERTEEGRYIRVSNNDRWYSDYYAEHGHAPSKAEMRQIVLDALNGDNPYHIAPDDELEARREVYDELARRTEVLDSVRNGVMDADVKDLAVARELTKEGKMVYDRMYGELVRQGKVLGNRGIENSAAAGAMMLALHADRMAEVMNEIDPNHKYTAMDYLMKFNVVNNDLQVALNGKKGEINEQAKKKTQGKWEDLIGEYDKKTKEGKWTRKDEGQQQVFSMMPEILGFLGAKGDVLKIYGSFFNHVLKHPGMDLEVLKQLPKAMEHPLMVFEGNLTKNDIKEGIVNNPLNGEHAKVIMLLDVVNSNGVNIVVPVEINKTVDGDFVSFAISAYAKEDRQNLSQLNTNWLEKNMEKHLIYIDKEKSSQWMGANRNQLPGDFPTRIAALDENSILTEKDFVKSIYEQAAWHGSGTRFEKFDLGAIGTGEGAQAHGWGLYFANDKKVAEEYKKRIGDAQKVFEINGMEYERDGQNFYKYDQFREMVTDTTEERALQFLAGNDYKIKDALQNAKEYYEEHPNMLQDDEDGNVIEALENMGDVTVKSNGSLYEVEVPDNDVLLDEQKSFAEQPQKVQRAIRKIGKEIPKLEGLVENMEVKQDTYDGERFYRMLELHLGSDRAASELLNSYGIKGITYEGNQDGRCYVVFDDKAVEVVDVYNQENKDAAIKEYWKQEGERFVNEVDKKAGVSGAMITVCDTPVLLQNVEGAEIEDLPLQISSALAQSVQKTSGNGGKHNHGITREMLAQIPYALQHPAMVLKSATQPGDIVVVTDVKDSKGDTVFVPLVLNKETGSNGANRKANIIKSIYGKENEGTFVAKQALAGNILYVSKEKSSALMMVHRLQLPQTIIKQSLIVDKIVAEKERSVNEKILQQADGATLQGQSAVLRNGERFVSLLKDADATTFFHETGHIFYEDLKRMSEMFGAPEWVQRDYATLEGWLAWTPEQLKGYEGTSGYGQMAAIDKRIRELRGQEAEGELNALLEGWKRERWARAVEEYVYKGNVPSEGLRKLLYDLKRWLVKVYRAFRGAGVPMSDEVKAVMDRMLVSQDVVDASVARRDMERFKRAGGLDFAGESGKEVWENLMQTAREEAEAKVRELALADLAEERQKEMEEQRVKEREAAKEMFARRPHFAVKAFLDANPKADIDLLCNKAGITRQEYEENLKADGGSVDAAVDKFMRDTFEPMLQKEFYVSDEELRQRAEEALTESRYRAVLTAYESGILDKASRKYSRLYSKIMKEQAQRRKAQQEADRVLNRIEGQGARYEGQGTRYEEQGTRSEVNKEDVIKILNDAVDKGDTSKYSEDVNFDEDLNSMSKEGLLDKVKKFLQGLKGKEIIDPMGNKVRFDPKKGETLEHYALHLAAGKDNNGVEDVQVRRIKGTLLADRTIKKPLAVIEQANGNRMYLSIYNIKEKGFTDEVVVTVENEGKGVVVTSFGVQDSKKNKKASFNDVKNHIKNAGKILYFRSVSSGIFGDQRSTELSKGNIPSNSSYGNNITYKGVAVKDMTDLEKRQYREQVQKETIKQLKQELHNQKSATRNAALEVVRNCRKYAAKKLEELPVSQGANPAIWEKLAQQAQDRVTMLLGGFRFAEANEAKKEQLIYETMAAEAQQRQNRMARNNYRLKRKVAAMKRDRNVEYSHRYLYERVLWLFGLTGKMQTQWHKDYVGAFEIIERMKKTLELKGSDFGVEDVKLPLFLEQILREDNPLADSRVKGGFTSLTWDEYKQLSDFLDNVYVAGRDAKRICSFKDDAGNEILLDDAVERMTAESIERNGTHGTGSLLENKGLLERALEQAKEVNISLVKPERLLERLGQAAADWIYTPLKKCTDNEDVRASELAARTSGILQRYREEKLRGGYSGIENGKETLKELEDATAVDVMVERDSMALPVSGLVKKMKNVYRELFQFDGKPAKVRTKYNEPVFMAMSGFKETGHHAADKRVMYVVPYLREIIGNAIFLFDEDASAEKQKKGVKKYRYYAAKCNIDKEECIVRIVVEERFDGSLYYDNDVTSVDELKKDISSGKYPDPKSGLSEETSSFKHSIKYWWQKVNAGRGETPDNSTKEKIKHNKDVLSGFYDKKRYRVAGQMLTHEQVVCMGLNYGNVTNRKRVCDGYGISEDDVLEALKNLDGADWKLITEFWQVFEDMYDDYNRVVVKTTGAPMGKVQPSPFAILGNDGVLYKLKGGYYPIVFDAEKNSGVMQREFDEAARTQMSGAQRTGMGMGSSKERAKGDVLIPVDLHLDAGLRKMQEVVHAICFRETVRDLYKLVTHDGFRTMVTGTLGEREYDAIYNWVLDCWKVEPKRLDWWTKVMRTARMNMTMGVLGYRTVTTALNFANIPIAMHYVGPVRYVKAVLDFYSAPKKYDEFVTGKSVFMKERAEQLDRDVRELAKRKMNKGIRKSGKVMGFFRGIGTYAFTAMAFTDRMGTEPLWMSEYEREFSECVDKGYSAEVCERRAVDAGDKAVRQAYGSGRNVDLSSAQKGGKDRSEAIKAATMYYSYFNALYNFGYKDVYETVRKRRAGASWAKAMKPVMDGILYMVLLQAVIETAIREVIDRFTGGGDDDKPLWKKLFGTMIGTVLGTVPILREIGNGLARKIEGDAVFGSKGMPLQQAADEVLNVLGDIGSVFGDDEFVTSKFLKDLSKLSVPATGLPKTVTDIPYEVAEFMEYGDFSFGEWCNLAKAVAFDKSFKKVSGIK